MADKGHTELPWDWIAVGANASGGFHLYMTDPNGRKIAALWGKAGEKEANATLIVTAVNTYPAVEGLVSAVGDLLRWVEPIAGDNRDDAAAANEVLTVEQVDELKEGAISDVTQTISAYLGDTHVDGWQEVERAPILGSDDEPKIVLVWVADGGHGKGSIASGRCYKLADGKVRSSAIGFYGNWNITHWMPMPDGPLSAELTERDAG